VALIEIFAAVIGLTAAIVTAFLGWGVYALVTAAIVSTWLVMLLSWLFLAEGWRPALRMRWSETKWFVRFGGGMVLNNLINHINATVDLVLGGRLLGATQLGLYSVPRNLILQIQFMVNPIFTRVGFPLIASIQNDKDRVRRVYLKTMNMTASVNAPIYVFLGFFAPEIVLILLGEKWIESAVVLQILAAWGLFRSFGNPVGSLFFGLGQVRRSVIWNSGMLLVVPALIWLGSQWGTLGMAWAMTGIMIIGFVPGWAYLVRPTCGATLFEYAREVFKPSCIAVISGLLAWAAASFFDSALIRLLLGGTAGVVAYLLLSWLFNRDFMLMGLQALRRQGVAGAT
jgi:O-antigen/teichoic acid export membrane protein